VSELKADPHSQKAYAHVAFIEDTKRRAWWKDAREKNDAIFRELKDTGLEFRGWRFWPPFFCFYCGTGITCRQWLFARACGYCDVGNGMAIRRLIGLGSEHCFAGRVEKVQQPSDSMPVGFEGFIDPTKGRGKQMAEHAERIKTAKVTGHRPKPRT